MGNFIRIGSSFDKKAEQGVKGLEDSVKRLRSQGAKGLGLGIGVAATTKAFSVLDSAISGVVQGVFGSIDAASSLNEAMFKSSQVFGDSAGDIEAWAATASDSFGQSKRQAIQAASGFGDLLQISGLATDAARDMSKSLTELASDLASMNDTSVDDALVALKAGLVGETEPMRRFGALLSEARVKAKAYELGIAKLGATLTEGQKVQARYAVIMGDTSRAQGVFGADSNSLADAQRSLNAAVEDVSAEIGGVMLPVVNALARAIRDNLAPALQFLQDVGAGAEFQDRQITQSLTELGDVWHAVFGEQATLPLDILNRKLAESGEGTRVLADRAHDLAGGIDDASHSARLFPRAARPMRVALDDLRERADDAGAALSEALFGEAGLKGNRAGLQQELADTNKEIDKLEKVKDPTAAQRRSLTQLKGRASELKGELLEVNTKLALLGDKPTRDDLIPYLVRVSRGIGDAADEARRLLFLLNQAGATSFLPPRGNRGKRAGGSSADGLASGGPVMAGVPYTVGERGSETFIPATNGMIAPHGAAWGGGVTVNFNSTWPPTTQQAREIAAVIERELAKSAGRAPSTQFAR